MLTKYRLPDNVFGHSKNDINPWVAVPEFVLETGEVFMKILVVDDSAVNRRSAEVTLVGHEVTILGSYDDAMLCMWVAALPEAHFIESFFAHKRALPKNLSFDPAQYQFEIVLLDLMLPASMEMLSEESIWDFRRKPLLPYGMVMAMVATKIPSVKEILVVTATNHHDHPMSAALDRLREPFYVNGKRIHYINARFPPVEGVTEATKCPFCRGTGRGRYQGGKLRPKFSDDHPLASCWRCQGCNGTGRSVRDGKNWGAVLRQVLGTESLERSG